MRLKGLLVGLVLALVATAAWAAPDLSRMSGGELQAFLRAMPKGGELHNHYTAGVFAEVLFDWAIEDGGCVDVPNLVLRASCPAGAGLTPAAEALANEATRSALIDSLTVRHPSFRDRLGHDQFFTAFGRMNFKPERAGDILGEVMDGLARQNTFYLEAMSTPQGGATRVLGAKVGWKDDLAAAKSAMEAAGIDKLVPVAIAETDALEARARAYLKCGTPQPRPGCKVTVRYLVQTGRQQPPEQTFAQLQMGVALIRADKRWVGLQLVAPEDSATSIKHYRLHMRMVDFLTDHGRLAPAALHAGELSLKYATPAELSYHVAEAVQVAGAKRIGHGTDIAGEDGAEALAAEMAAKGILVEVNLSSNAAILEVEGKAHPYAWLRQRGVPTSLSTDDAGILRIDLTHEYVRAAGEGATYEDLKNSARNAIAFGFLAGEGLWADPGTYRRPAKACAGQIGAEAAKAGTCADLLAASDKAREQWRHEALLAAFERTWGR